LSAENNNKVLDSAQIDCGTRLLVEILKEKSSMAGTPLVIVRGRLNELARNHGLALGDYGVDVVIQHALDKWVVDKTIAELDLKMKKELGLPYLALEAAEPGGNRVAQEPQAAGQSNYLALERSK
jgi:hypothetical protein